MTKETYGRVTYKGKHEPRQYTVWRVLGPAGPEERLTVTGLPAVRAAVLGCWDWEVHNDKGERVYDRFIFAEK